MLSRVRWTTLAALLLLTVIQPQRGRTVLPSQALILIFLGYNLLIELLRPRVAWLATFACVPVLDLPVVAVLYFLSLRTGGPIFVLVLLVTTCAAASMALRHSLVYTGMAMLLVAIISPTLPTWPADVVADDGG